MVELTLPRNSQVAAGRTWNSPEHGSWRELRIYRWNADDGGNPHLDTYWIDPAHCGPMILDALFEIRNEIDSTLVFRRSCREGICGSCSMNINGQNRLACMTPIDERSGTIWIYPLPHMRVIRDLVPDLGQFFAHYHAMEPQLHAEPPLDGREHRQSPEQRHELDGLYECILCACCSSACPSYWWNSESFPGPAALLQANRWIQDTRDHDTEHRLEIVEQPKGVYGCRQIMNCAKVCPKGLNPAQAISELRRLLMARR